MKTTYAESVDPVTGEVSYLQLFKDPVTDNGNKKSAKGYVCVAKGVDGNYKLVDELDRTSEALDFDQMKPICINGRMVPQEGFEVLRARLASKRTL